MATSPGSIADRCVLATTARGRGACHPFSSFIGREDYGPDLYARLMTTMTVRHIRGEPMERALAWAESEVEGLLRK